MPNRKISAFASAASAQASTLYPVVSGGNTNKSITQHTMLQTLGIPQYVEVTCLATTTIANLPADSNIFDIYVRCIQRSSGAAGGTTVNIGRAGAAAYFGEIVVSAKGIWRQESNIGNSILGDNELIKTSGAVVAAAPTATAAANFAVGIGYFRV